MKYIPTEDFVLNRMPLLVRKMITVEKAITNFTKEERRIEWLCNVMCLNGLNTELVQGAFIGPYISITPRNLRPYTECGARGGWRPHSLTWLLCGIPYSASTRSAALLSMTSCREKQTQASE